MININGTLVNIANVCAITKQYQITAVPGQPEKKDYFRMSIQFTNEKIITVTFDSAEDLDINFSKLELL